MAEKFLFNIADKVLGKVGSLTLQEVWLSWGVESEVDKLKSTISAIQSVLLDAEEKQAKNNQLRDWLGKLKDALYDADDVLDEFHYEALRSQVANRGGITGEVRKLFSSSNSLSFRFKMGHKIKGIKQRFKEIAAEKAEFHLTERCEDTRVVHGEREMTHSFVLPSEIIAREHDKEHIVGLLMAPGDGKDIPVIPIVGIGGLGKTALTKLVYNDERVVSHFDIKIWVCVSDDFDVAKLAKEIIKSSKIGENCNESNFDQSLSDSSIDKLQYLLRSTLFGKIFLLILDDVWNQDREKWMKLRELLLGGADGSKIVVTTRSQSVASIMGTIGPYNLTVLSHKDSLFLFQKLAFKEGDETKYPNLIEIGEEIVKKCGGVPLAIRTLGGLLYSKIDEYDWMHIKNSEIWEIEQTENHILPALKLSYDALPSYLKQCFSYCSLFPKDHMFNSQHLIPLWIAQGLIKSSIANQNLEDVGQQYVKELLLRSFFQESEVFATNFCFKMHDLIHDLALSVTQSEFSNCLTQNSSSKKIRHVSFCDGNLLDLGVSKYLLKLDNLRTIMFPNPHLGPKEKSFPKICITRFKYLRMLDLSNSSFEELPASLGSLKHLGYLNLHNNRSIKRLPDSICKLYNLQALDIAFCMSLQSLPRDIGNLIGLKLLSFSTREEILPEEGIGRLKSLQHLGIYSSYNLKSLGKGMQDLTNLRTLEIYECVRLKEISPHGMRNLTTLEKLYIWNCEMLMRSEEDIQGLNLSLRRLEIDYFLDLVDLPLWIRGSAKTMQYLNIKWLTSLTALPEWLQDFTSLQTLLMRKCTKLQAMPNWMPRLTALRELQIESCPRLMRRCQRESGEDWPYIAHVPKLHLDGIIEETSQ